GLYGLQDGLYFAFHMLVPLKTPPGHSFHLEQGPKRKVPEKNSCVLVKSVCTCAREERMEDVLCFLHHSEEEIKSRQQASLLETLCTTSSHLDVEKTTYWFQQLVNEVWATLPWKDTFKLTVLPCSCLCKLKLTCTSKKSYIIELKLAVQQGDSSELVCLT
ncbi:IPIL1 protein, partial [Upupa epops]|nr:IPIL1 protein [Upupa epops]